MPSPSKSSWGGCRQLRESCHSSWITATASVADRYVFAANGSYRIAGNTITRTSDGTRSHPERGCFRLEADRQDGSTGKDRLCLLLEGTGEVGENVTAQSAIAARQRAAKDQLMKHCALVASLALLPPSGALAATLADTTHHPCPVTADGSLRADTISRPRFPSGFLGAFTGAEVDCLRRLLALPESRWGLVRAFYFGTTYLPNLPDVLVYIASPDSIRQTLIRRGNTVQSRVLRGEKYVYILLFSDLPLDRVTKDSANAPDSIRITRTSIDYQRDPFLVTVFKGFGSKLFGVTVEPRSVAVSDTTVTVSLDSLGTGETIKRPLYVAFVRLRLADETWNRVHIAGARGRRIQGSTIVTNFGNAGRSRFGVSIGGGFTYRARMRALKDTSLVPTGEYIRFSLYLFSHLYIVRPSLPWRGRSVGLTAGTNLVRGEPLNDLVAGISFSRLIGDMGMIIGVNALPTKLQDGSDTRRPRAFVAIDFHL